MSLRLIAIASIWPFAMGTSFCNRANSSSSSLERTPSKFLFRVRRLSTTVSFANWRLRLFHCADKSLAIRAQEATISSKTKGINVVLYFSTSIRSSRIAASMLNSGSDLTKLADIRTRKRSSILKSSMVLALMNIFSDKFNSF